MSTKKFALIWLFPMFAAACTSTAPPEGGGDGEGGEGGESGSGGVRGGAAGTPQACEGGPSDPGAAMARLTPLQYRNTLKTLLADPTFEPPELPAQLPPPGFAFSSHVRSQAVSETLVQALSRGAQEAALRVGKNVSSFAPCNEGSERQCGEAFVQSFGKRAFRRPLRDDEKERYQAFFVQALEEHGYGPAVEMVSEALLSSPQFLYRIDSPEGDEAREEELAYHVASRISFLLTDDMPDEELLEAAGSGALKDSKKLRDQISRLYRSEHGRATTSRFMGEWFNVAALAGLSKDSKAFPEFNAAMVESLRTSYMRTLESAVVDGGSLSTLLTGKTYVVDENVAKLLGVTRSGTAFSPLDLSGKPQGEERAGFLTHPAWLAMNAHDTVDAPVIRGLFVLERLLCLHPPPPPDGVPELKPFEGKMTARMALEQTHQVRGCVECHAAFDPFGFAFGHYDAIGRYRTVDSGFDVDAKVDLPEPVSKTVNDALELANVLAEHDATRRCAAIQWFRHAVGREEDEESDRCFLDQLSKSLAEGQGDLEALVMALAAHPSFLDTQAGVGP